MPKPLTDAERLQLMSESTELDRQTRQRASKLTGAEMNRRLDFLEQYLWDHDQLAYMEAVLAVRLRHQRNKIALRSIKKPPTQ